MASAVRSVSCAFVGTDRDRDNLGRCAFFLQADRFFDRDFVKRVHAHFDVGQIDARAIGLYAGFHVIVDHPLYGDEDFHGALPSS